MEIIVVIVGCLIAIILIYFTFGIKLKKIKELTKNERIKELTDRFPEDKEICKEMLSMIDNNKVKIKQSENDRSSVYIAVTDTIVIGNMDRIYTRIQTIAHECLHSIQNRKMLLFNFIYTNIYNVYFVIISILTILGILKNTNIQIIILLFMGILFYMVRSYLELDAMIKAKYLADDYMKKYIHNNSVCSIEEINEITKEYDNVNKYGIPVYMFSLILKPIIKIIIYSIISLVITGGQKL